MSYEIQGHKFCSNLRPFSLGGADLILGVDWLRKYNPVTFDYQGYKISIKKERAQVVLQGMVNKGGLQTITGKGLCKLLRSKDGIAQGCICMLTSGADVKESDNNSLVQPVQQLLDKYQGIFAEPQGMPPIRSHDHKILLLEGSQPFNQRGYKVPYVQKAEIEKQIKDMLATGIIQKSSSPYASSIILVKKKDGSCVCVWTIDSLIAKQ